MSDFSAELIWARYAVNINKITRSQLQLCIEEQGHLKERGRDRPLADILVKHKFIDKSTVKQLVKLKGMIPDYTIRKVIGAGGVGIVYQAYAEKLRKNTAIKILNPEYTDNALLLNRFLREIDISKRLNHPNIIKGIDSGRIEDLYYLVMEYVPGENLAEYIKKHGALEENQVLTVGVEIADALSYAWNEGLTHRDIKPENIICTRSGSYKVGDFGLAKLADVNIALTVSGTIVGTPYYISPEQVTGDRELDYRSDIYSLGATLYFLATGRYLFDEKTLIAFCNAHVHHEPLPPSHHANVSKLFDTLVMRMLSKNPDRRCASAQEFVHNLRVTAQIANRQGTKKMTQLSLQKIRDKITVVNLPKLGLGQGKSVGADQVEFEDTIVTSIPKRNTNDQEKPVAENSVIAQNTANNINDALLQHLLLSLSNVKMSQFSECVAKQAELRLAGVSKSLPEILVEKRYIEAQYMKNLRIFCDANGETLLPNYRILKSIGEGPFAAVFLAQDVKNGDKVTLKIFSPAVSNHPGIVRYMRDIKDGGFKHTNIVDIIESGTVYGIYYMVREYMPGPSLRQLIDRDGPITEDKALQILHQLLAATTYAWKRECVHQRIKPDNILSNGNLFKVCDFGLVEALPSDVQSQQQNSPDVTLQFMSPEHFQAAQKIDFRSDVYSLGIVLYFMLTGNYPYEASSNIALAQAHLYSSPKALEKFDINVSKATKTLLKQMLAKKAGKRCKYKTELLEHVHKLRHKQKGTSDKTISTLNIKDLSEAAADLVTMGSKKIRQFAQKTSARYKKIRKSDIFANSGEKFKLFFQATGNNYQKIRQQGELSLTRTMTIFKPNDPRVRYNLGLAYERRGQFDNAISEYRKAIELKPKFIDAYQHLGNVYRKKGNIEEALVELRKVQKLNPEDATTYYNLGNAYYDQGDNARAIKAYKKAISLSPNFALAYTNLGNVYYKQRTNTEAIAAYKKALTINPQLAEAHYNLGLIYKRQRKINKAVEEWKKAIAIKPDYPDAHHQLGDIYLNRGKVAEAKHHLQKYLDYHPKASDSEKIRRWMESLAQEKK